MGQIIVLYIFFSVVFIDLIDGSLNSDVGLDIYQFADKYGYQIKRYGIETEDGYILGTHRITRKGQRYDGIKKPPVLFAHGIFISSMDWVATGPNDSLAFSLVDLEYDVWMLNFRGNTYSRKHVSLDPDDNLFWDFSFNEMGRKDLPAVIDFILKETKYDQLTYIGYSMGTTAFFVMASDIPKYNDKIKAMVALAPVGYIGNITDVLARVFSERQANILLELLVKRYDWYELFPHKKLISKLPSGYCQDEPRICVQVVNTLLGKTQLKESIVPFMASYLPSGSSYKLVQHYIQEYVSGYFRKYDYGEKQNLRRYNQTTPPDYPVEKITAPIALYHSKHDVFASIPNIKKLVTKLPNVIKEHLVHYEDFSHFDFLYSYDINIHINNGVRHLIKKLHKV